jgi:hypothetical protein
MLSPIVTFREDGTAHIELGGGHLIAYHYYTDTGLTGTVVETLTTPDGFTEQQHRVVGVWSGPDQIYGSWTIAYALGEGVTGSAPIFDALSDVKVHSGGYKVASLVALGEWYSIALQARHLMDTGALSPTPHNLMAHTTKDTA